MSLAAATPVEPSDTYWVSPIGDIGYLDDPDEVLLSAATERFSQRARELAEEEKNTATPKPRHVQWIAPADLDNEHLWSPAKLRQIKAGEKVRVLRDAYSDLKLGMLHNGRILEVIEVKDGDVICASIDEREPKLNGAHYAPYTLEQWQADYQSTHGGGTP